MRIVKEHEGRIIECDYPRFDFGVIDGCDEQYYILHEEVQPTINEVAQYIIADNNIELTDISDNLYPHLKIALKKWIVVDKSTEIILKEINDKFGAWIDEEYPIWQRIKHSDELQRNDLTPGRREYLKAMKAWELMCRDMRDNVEIDLLENDNIPCCNYPQKPQYVHY